MLSAADARDQLTICKGEASVLCEASCDIRAIAAASAPEQKRVYCIRCPIHPTAVVDHLFEDVDARLQIGPNAASRNRNFSSSPVIESTALRLLY